MIQRVEYAGGTRCEALPGGRYQVLFPGRSFKTHDGQIPLPGFDVLFARMSVVAGLQLAGQAQSGPLGTWRWHGDTGWTHASPEAPGIWPCIFDRTGALHIAGPAQGSQGYRYVSDTGELVSGDDTLNAQRRLGVELGLRDVWEFTHRHGITIGQGNYGCVVIYQGRRYLLEPGGCFDILFSATGRELAVAMWKRAENSAVLYWLNEEDILTLPLEPTTTPHPEPQPQPEPQPEPNPVSTPNELAVVHAVNAEFPHLLQINTIVSCTEFTQRVLARLNGDWGHVAKTAGEGQGVPVGFTPRDVNGHHITGVSYDVIFHQPSNRQVDIIANGTANEPGPWPHGPGTPIWAEIDREHYRPNNPWIPKVPLQSTTPQPDPDPEPEPQPNPGEIDRLRQQMQALSQKLDAEIARIYGELHDEIQQAVSNLPAPTLPADVVRESTHRIDVGRSFGHSHAATFQRKP